MIADTTSSAPPTPGDSTVRRRALALHPAELHARELAMTPASRRAISASGAPSAPPVGSVADA